MELVNEIKQLQQTLNRHAYLYHTLGTPEISDHDYDRMFMRLVKLETLMPECVTPDSPTQRIGAKPAPGFVKVKHAIPMTSLANAFDDADLDKWYRSITRVIDIHKDVLEFVVEPKIDGLAVTLIYENGILSKAVTRGDGNEGEDVTANVRTIRSIPLRIPAITYVPVPTYIEVRGEVYMPLGAFAEYNAKLTSQGESPISNPRNGAVGSLRQLDSKVTAERPLAFYAYHIAKLVGHYIYTQEDALIYLKNLGFPVNGDIMVASDLTHVKSYIKEWMTNRDKLDYDADGAVVKVNKYIQQQELGMSSTNPRWAIAYKFPAREATSRVLKIVDSVGRTGKLIPNAIIESVEIGGVIIQHVVLHNYEDLARKDIRVGDTVVVKRAGDVIPQITHPILSKRPADSKIHETPKLCPVCSKTTKVEGAHIFCVNDSCPAQFVRLLQHFVSKGAMDIEGFGNKLAIALVEANLIGDLDEIYDLTVSDLTGLEGMGQKKAMSLIAEIEKSKKASLVQVLTGVGIPSASRKTIETICQAGFHTISKFMSASVDDFRKTDIGEVAASKIHAWFNDSDNRILIENLETVGLEMKYDGYVPANNSLAGKSFVVTGTLPTMTRTEVITFIQENGGQVQGGVSKATNYLVAGSDAGSKLDKAVKLNIPVITEAELRAMA